jgi:hypothetical protein
MAMTLSDMNRRDYLWFRSKGHNDETIKNVVGENRFNAMKRDMELTPMESHFGKGWKWWFLVCLGVVLVTLIILIYG